MKLRNKKTLKVFDVEIRPALYENIAKIKLKDIKTGAILAIYNTLAELNEEWEDYKEPVEFYYIDRDGRIVNVRTPLKGLNSKVYNYELAKQIGNVFETQEEAKKAVEKLKAWKRLKDEGAMFKGWFWDKIYGTCIIIGDSECDCIDDGDEQNRADLDLLFGGEDA